MKVVAHAAIVPMRSEAKHASEQVSQLLKGEYAEVLESLGDWLWVKSLDDSYTGHVVAKQVAIIQDTPSPIGYQQELLSQHSSGLSYFGSPIYSLDAAASDSTPLTRDEIVKLSEKLEGVPYQWGGRTSAGFDCSGFVQVLFRMGGLMLPRDAKDQATQGVTLSLIQEAIPGDLAFFDNEKGQITHVGLIIENNLIRHASNWVRTDRIDSYGIFTDEWGYTHSLRLLKRFPLLK